MSVVGNIVFLDPKIDYQIYACNDGISCIYFGAIKFIDRQIKGKISFIATGG